MLIALLLSWVTVPPAPADQLWDTYAEYATRLDAIAPTPIGDSHVGVVKSGDAVQLRFPVPKGKLLGYWLSLGNIVAYSGRGSSYQLVLHRDAKDGPVIYEGPVIANGDQWNGDNGQIKDISSHVTAADQQSGYVDVWATGLVAGDDWTVYRHNPQGRPIQALAAVASPELEAQLAAAKALADAGIAIIPMPREVKLEKAHLRLYESPNIWLGPGTTEEDAFAAQDLADQIAARTATKPVVVREKPGPGHITLRAAKAGELGSPGVPGQYVLRVTPANGVEIVGADAAARFYGAQTLAQLIQDDKTNVRPEIAALAIRDWPAFPLRSIQYDIARGQTVDVEFCKDVIRDLARYKLNNIMFYMEDDFKFTKYPFTGRPGTFTPEKAKTLSAYARKYHMSLTPQYEALGHAGAVLSHPELADLREAGGSWVFCTSEPRTWVFLRDVFTELAACFPDSPYLHVGGDEFEGGFGLCEHCKPKGIGPLYVEHMTKLNDICKSLGKTMLFWPSHGGPTAELSYLSLKNAAAMPHDSIPTEWIYHGPPTYPEIAQYQEAGYRDVWVCPAVVSYSRLLADYPTTFRGIRGFYRAGAERKVGGACTTTWEFMHGALLENSWLGLCYAAECGWSLGATTLSDYERRYAASWLGVRQPAAAALVADTLAEPIPGQGAVARWRDTAMMSGLLFTPLTATQRRYALKQPPLVTAAADLLAAMDGADGRLKQLDAGATRGKETLFFAGTLFRMMRLCGMKLTVLDHASKLYAEARAAGPAKADEAAARVREAADEIGKLLPPYQALSKELRYAVEHCGAYDGDLKSIDAQLAEAQDLSGKLTALAESLAGGKAPALPAPAELGLERGVYTRVAEWTPAVCSEKGFEIRADVTAQVRAGEALTVEFEYTGGAHGLKTSRAALLVNGQEASVDEHGGWTGASNQGNQYHLAAPKEIPAGAKLELVAAVASSGGNDSAGTVWLARGD